MSRLDPSKCRRAKTAIASEAGNIQGMSERFIAESGNYLTRRIGEKQYDPSLGEDPIKVRYSSAPIEEREYVQMLVQGDEDGTMPARNCNGGTSDLDTTINRKGAYGCNLPGQTIHGGYDVFTRELRGKAYETEEMCAMDLILKAHFNAYIRMLREDLPKRAAEQFEYALQRQVIEAARYNTSCVSGFTYSAGAFPAAPQGMLDLGTVRRVFQIMEAQGWMGAREVTTSIEAFENMRLNYKTNYGIEMEVTPGSSETHYLDPNTKVVNWAGITWVLEKHPNRGYLRTNGSGDMEFVPVRPVIARAGTGGGVVSDINEDYFAGFTYCDGERHEIYELGFYVNPKACTRESFAMPQVADKRFSNRLFNFEVNMIDGPYIPCNTDNLKFFFRLMHAFAFESMYPELMGSIIYRIQPDLIFVNTPVNPRADDSGPTVAMAPANPQIHDECSYADQNDDCAEDLNQAVLPEPDQREDVVPGAGLLRFVNTDIITETDAGTLKVWVERIGGVLGAATATVNSANGTAVTGTDFTTPGATVLSWADGEAGRKAVSIPILPGGAGDKAFTVVKSAATGATWDGDTSATVTIDTAFDVLP